VRYAAPSLPAPGPGACPSDYADCELVCAERVRADDERICFMIVRGKRLESGRIGLTIMET
jgi:hypothetical protein